MTDWKKIVDEILTSGYTQTELAMMLNCEQGTISKILNGKMTKIEHEMGEALISIYQEI